MIERRELSVDLVDAIVVRFEGGALASIASTGSSLAGHDETLEVRLFGTDGHITLDISRGRATVYGRDGSTETLEPLPEKDRCPEWAPSDNLVDIVLGRGTNGSPSWLGVAAVELVDAMYRSARAGHPVRVGPG
jgi:predicted dehydrogenase